MFLICGYRVIKEEKRKRREKSLLLGVYIKCKCTTGLFHNALYGEANNLVNGIGSDSYGLLEMP